MNVAMTKDEIRLLQASLRPQVSYLEFGSGGSTILALDQHVAHVDSVDSDRAWIARLRENDKVRHAEQSGVLCFHHFDIGPVGDWGMPLDRACVESWPKYFLAVWGSIKYRPDVVLVDGRFRTACGVAALICCAPDAALLVHDFDPANPMRANYARLLEFADVEERADNLVRLRRRLAATNSAMLGCLNDVWNDYF